MAANKPMPVSTEMTQGASVAPTQVEAGASLAADLQNMMGNANKMNTTNKQATVKLAKRQAADSRNQLAMELTAIESQVTPETDERETQSQINAAYLKHNNNENLVRDDAKQAFNDEYTAPMAESTGKMNAKLEIKYRERKSTESQSYASMTINNDIALGKQQTLTDRTEYEEQYTLYGYKTKAEADKSFAGIINTGFETEQAGGFGKILSGSGYNAEEGITQPVMDKTFNDRYSAFGKMENGSIKWDKNLDEDTKNSILKSWGSYNSAISKLNSDDINIPLQVHNNKVDDDITAAENGSLTSEQQKTNIKFNQESYNDLNSPSADVSLTKSQKETGIKKMSKEEIAYEKTAHVEKMMTSDKDTFRKLLQNGGEVTVDGRVVKYSKEFIKGVVTTQQGLITDQLNEAKFGSPEFGDSLIKANELTNLTGVKNSVVQSYYNNITGNGRFTSIEDIQKSTYASKQAIIDGTSNDMIKNVAFTASIDRVNARRANGEFSDDQAYVDAANASIRQMRTGIYARVDSNKFSKSFYDAKEAGELAGMWTIDTNINEATMNALMYRYAAQGSQDMSEEALGKFIKDNTIAFSGTWTSLANSWMPDSVFGMGTFRRSNSGMTLSNSNGQKLKTTIYEDAMDNITDAYNEEHPNSTIDVSDIEVQSYYDGGKNESEGGWRVMFRDDNGALQPLGGNDGRYNGSQLTVWAGKVTEEVKQKRFYSNTVANIATTKGK